ncbi:MAG: hypothetical protein WDN10_05160 [bacterium]
MYRTLTNIGVIVVAFVLPRIVSAHEMYVLSAEEVRTALASPSFDMLAVLQADLMHFIYWACIGMATVIAVFFVSVSRSLERRCDPFFLRVRRYAAPVARITIGLSFLAAAYYQATYGPELPLSAAYGAYASFATALLVLIGVLTILGFYVRFAALVALLFFAYAAYRNGIYMLTYANYLGEILVLLILGSHHGASPKVWLKGEFGKLEHMYVRFAKKLAPYSFAVLRICFGISLLYSSLYAKILHNNLALTVANLPLPGRVISVAGALGFEPHFLVLGAAIIEIVLALFFIFGIELLFTSFFLLFWLMLSLLYFGEAVWPHIILIGLPIAFILSGYDKYSLEGKFFKKKGGWEPVL